ncbi:TetR/AcrR family transcriptional regulator [Nonlabens ponticola]|uniref:TetR/AcrR family transcriptional regulator n=1 Tax=Nonlabens ponticola TaxID=2496866 RepID=A0A3S9MV36_9FLAO|nr:TetR/AcrR family transcriptional regulator [Nonlabens ponticola]AZQ43037.1 TetR/AcrR family transcriptional regulator [Nonlabens ponticola]
MRNPEHTRELIIKTSADLFNTQGYKSTSLRDITKATGLTKGAIYKHFKNKEHLERAALKRLATTMFNILGTQIKEAKSYQEKMDVVFKFFENYLIEPPYAGGCPLLNSAVEVDDKDSIMRDKTRLMLQKLKDSIIKIMHNGKNHGQIKQETNIEQMCYVFIATLEGAIMLSKLEGTNDAMQHCVASLKQLNNNILT